MVGRKIFSGANWMVIFIGGERHGFEVPDEAGPGKRFEQVVGDVNFPPVKALARGVHVAVMIVVPAFAERDQRENKAVAAVVLGFVTAFAEQVRQRIDAGRRVKQNRGADEKSPDEQLPRSHAERRAKYVEKMAEREQRDGKQSRHERIEAVQENQFGKFCQVAHLRIIRRKIPRAGDPADVRPPEAADAWANGHLLPRPNVCDDGDAGSSTRAGRAARRLRRSRRK